MLKKTTIAVFLVMSVFVAYAYSIGMTGEFLLNPACTEKYPLESEVYGNIFLSLVKSDLVASDLHFKLGENRNRINVAYIKFMKYKFDLIVGRQLMAWGSGYNFNPTDIFNTKPIGAAFDPSYLKNGRDAVVLSSYFTKAALDVVYAADYSIDSRVSPSESITEKGDESSGVRLKSNIYDFDVAFSYILMGEKETEGFKDKKESIEGLSLKGSIPYLDWGVWFEGAKYTDSGISEWVSGLEYYYDKYSFNFEYYNNGFGSINKEEYNSLLLLKGVSLGKNYIIPSIVYTYDERTTVSVFSLNNLDDTSSITGCVFDYLYNDNIEIALTPFVLQGDILSEYGMQRESLGSYGLQGLVKLTF